MLRRASSELVTGNTSGRNRQSSFCLFASILRPLLYRSDGCLLIECATASPVRAYTSTQWRRKNGEPYLCTRALRKNRGRRGAAQTGSRRRRRRRPVDFLRARGGRPVRVTSCGRRRSRVGFDRRGSNGPFEMPAISAVATAPAVFVLSIKNGLQSEV